MQRQAAVDSQLQSLVAQINALREAADKQQTQMQQVQSALQQAAQAIQAITADEQRRSARIERLEKVVDQLVKRQAATGEGGAPPVSPTEGTITPSGATVLGELPKKAKTPALVQKLAAGEQAKQETKRIYIPTGTRLRVRLLNYILAPAGGLAQVAGANSPAYPAFVKIISNAELDDGTEINTAGGVALIMCVGDASNERAMPRVRAIRFYDGEDYYEIQNPEATLFDLIDHAPGLMGVLDTSKRGREIAKAATLSAAKVVSQALSLQAGGLQSLAVPQINP
ncbi:MAG: hypothetical protein D6771_07120, partial [Zetaproteobacteria bacterium]